ncbi:MAG: HlyC/CorC family transporter [bacterium]|nr:HlyC/CorC family transporter [bacterium]
MLDFKIDTIIIYEIIIFILIVLSAFFSGAETALVSSNRLKLESFAKSGKRRARRSLRILDNIEDAMGMILIGNNVVNIAATSFIAYVAVELGRNGEWEQFAVTIVQTIVFLLLCEVSPKVVAKVKAESYLMFFSYPIRWLMFALRPLNRVSLFIPGLLKKLFKIEEGSLLPVRSRDEIDLLFRVGEKEGIIDEDHQSYISEILSFKDIAADNVMVPTIDITSVDIGCSVKNLVELITKTKFSRIPVYEGRVDNIIGYIFFRDIIKNPGIKKISEIITRPYYVPETKKISELYMEMQEKAIPVSFVVNEYGAVTGMVTHEDIAEEIVGEIQTEDHPEESLITKMDSKKYLLRGDTDIDYFNKYFSLEIEKKGFETVAGYITYELGKIPRKGEEIKLNKNKLIVEEATERSVEKVVFLFYGKTLGTTSV